MTKPEAESRDVAQGQSEPTEVVAPKPGILGEKVAVPPFRLRWGDDVVRVARGKVNAEFLAAADLSGCPSLFWPRPGIAQRIQHREPRCPGVGGRCQRVIAGGIVAQVHFAIATDARLKRVIRTIIGAQSMAVCRC